MKTATYKGRPPGRWITDARWYELSEPVEYNAGWDKPKRKTSNVIVSAAEVFGMPETYIFPANKDGYEITMYEITPGSFRGRLDHAQALEYMGFKEVE